jgi:hypothetical protein
MSILKRIAQTLERLSGVTIEAKTGHGQLEVDCIVFKPDGTIKSRETAVRPVNMTFNHLKQVTKVEDIIVGGKK